jgi:putative spermidine/putrescine transport system substrate-binding protein
MTKAVEEKRKSKIRRRQVLNVAAAGAGLAVGSGLVRGFPTVWAQNIKDIKLVQVRVLFEHR